MTPAAVAWTAAGARRRVADYVALTKPRVVSMVLVTTCVGYYLGSRRAPDVVVLFHTLAATALAAAGTMALNQWMERDLDARMARTRQRPLPDGRLRPGEALALGLALVVAGVVWLWAAVNPVAAAVTASIAGSYLLLYTPMKRLTPWCSPIGAIPGALPPVAGWAAAAGTLGPEPWILFAIMFLWQIPHTLAIGCVYREDYARAGVRVLPVIDGAGARTGIHALWNSLVLVPVALLPTAVGLAGSLYAVVALVLGLMMCWTALGLFRRHSIADARRLLFASLIYLPVLLAAMALDKLPFVP